MKRRTQPYIKCDKCGGWLRNGARHICGVSEALMDDLIKEKVLDHDYDTTNVNAPQGEGEADPSTNDLTYRPITAIYPDIQTDIRTVADPFFEGNIEPPDISLIRMGTNYRNIIFTEVYYAHSSQYTDFNKLLITLFTKLLTEIGKEPSLDHELR